MKLLQCLFWITILSVIGSIGFAQNQGFTQEDRERMIRTEITLKNFMENVDQRFENVDQRFESMNHRLDKTDQTISELREDMNNRVKELKEDTNNRINELRADLNGQFDRLINILGGIVAAFTALTLGFFGFAFWDRRTSMKQAKKETLIEVESKMENRDKEISEKITQIELTQGQKLNRVIDALRKLAGENKSLATALKEYHLL